MLAPCRSGKREEKIYRGGEIRQRKEKRSKENRKNKLSIFRNCDLQFILNILLLSNKNKI
jgi:hypothetical protein